ncbi:hypothetical protein RJ639_007346 [Escallonia herrerae]|uniref:Prolamin-like domain-containing protein n=1 Tax=Escallonia herrerae TaxID=1293975 RepID=A0AA88VXS1_9ASTE|nr:hypothetical protein RJ639_007346 [Escallonia herrerae]
MAMVFYKFPFAILALFLVNGAVLALAKCRYRTQYDIYQGDDVTCLYPWDNDSDGYDLPSEPRTSFYNDLNGCVKVLTRKCSQQKYNYIFHKKKIDIQCCRKLIDMGRECDESLIWTLSNTKRYDRHSEVIRKRSDRAFEKCKKALRKESGGGMQKEKKVGVVALLAEVESRNEGSHRLGKEGRVAGHSMPKGSTSTCYSARELDI